MKTKFEKKMFDIKNLKEMFCVDRGNVDIYLKNTIDGNIIESNHVYLVLKAAECTEETRIEGDPQCSNKTEIHEYLSDKYLYINNIDQAANYGIDYDLDGNT
jgi:hypothetical protein